MRSGKNNLTPYPSVALLFSIALFVGCAGRETTVQPKPVIQYQYTGGPSSNGRMVYLLSIFEDGTVIFDGKHRTRVSGEARAQVGKEKVQEWLNILVDAGAMTVQERSDWAPWPDAGWWHFTISRGGKNNSYRFALENTRHPFIKAREKIFDDLDLRHRWVWEDAPTTFEN